jgi:hypothetical protein
VISYEKAVELTTSHTFRYIYGYENGSVRPEASITRAEIAQVFYNLAINANKESCDPNSLKFSDVDKQKWYSKAIAFVIENTLFSGYPDGTFKPERPITRAELAASLYTFLDAGPLGEQDSMFSDIGGHWAETYIKILAGYDVVSGYPDGTFKPDANISRGELVSIMNRILTRLNYGTSYLPEQNEYNDIDETSWAYNDIMNASGKEERIR